MKKIFTIAALALMVGFAGKASAQDKQKFAVGIGLEGALPTNAGYDYGGGATIRVAIPISDEGAVTGTTGIMAFIPKSITGLSTKAQLNIPIKGGYQHMLGEKFYGMGEAGFTIARVYAPTVSGSSSTVTSVSSTSFTYSVGVGYKMGFFEPSLRYEGYSSAGFVGLRLGFNF